MSDFEEELLPRAKGGNQKSLFEKGTYLGHPLIRKKVLEPTAIELLSRIIQLILRSDLIIGTSRNFRDDGKSRKSNKDNYNYVPYNEQLALARQITKYAQSHPRPDMDKLRRAGTTAIVLPYGYTLPTCWQLHTWGTHIYPLSRKNRFGLTYKDVLSPAIDEIAHCLENNISYDVVPAGKAFD